MHDESFSNASELFCIKLLNYRVSFYQTDRLTDIFSHVEASEVSCITSVRQSVRVSLKHAGTP